MSRQDEDYAWVNLHDEVEALRLLRMAIIKLGVEIVWFVWWPTWRVYHVVVDYRGLLFEFELNPAKNWCHGRRFEVRQRLNNYVAQVVDWQAKW